MVVIRWEDNSLYRYVYAFLVDELLDRSPIVDLKGVALCIKNYLQSFKLVKINRKANMMEHELAKCSFNNRCDGDIVSGVSPCARML